MAEMPLLIYTLLVQLASGIVFATQFAPATRLYLRNQTFFSLCFLVIAPLLSLVGGIGLPPHHNSLWTTREIYCLGALGAGLIAASWLRYQPDQRSFENIIGWAMTILSLCLLYAMSRMYDNPAMRGWQANTTFFLFLASALVLGSLWCAMTVTRIDWRRAADAPLPLAAVLGRLFFLSLSGFVLVAIFTPLALPVNSGSATMDSIASWHAWHAGLCGFSLLTFLVAIYQKWLNRSGNRHIDPDSDVPGLPAMGLAFILALLGEASGRVAFYLSYAPI